MAFGYQGDEWGGNSKTSGTTLVLNNDLGNAGAAVGDIIIVAVAADNVSTTDADGNNIQSVTDPKGNTYSKLGEWNNGQGGAGSGASVEIWFTRVTTALASGDDITVTFNTAITAKGGTAAVFTVGADKTIQVASGGETGASDDGVDPSDVTLSGLTNKEYLFLWSLAAEGPNSDAYTFDADYTWIAPTGGNTGTTGGGAASNMTNRTLYRIFTGTGDTVSTSSDTADRDYAQLYLALEEVDMPVAAGFGWTHAGWW